MWRLCCWCRTTYVEMYLTKKIADPKKRKEEEKLSCVFCLTNFLLIINIQHLYADGNDLRWM